MASGSLGQNERYRRRRTGQKLNNDPHIVYSLHGDGELDEGQNREAIPLRAHTRK